MIYSGNRSGGGAGRRRGNGYFRCVYAGCHWDEFGLELEIEIYIQWGVGIQRVGGILCPTPQGVGVGSVCTMCEFFGRMGLGWLDTGGRIRREGASGYRMKGRLMCMIVVVIVVVVVTTKIGNTISSPGWVGLIKSILFVICVYSLYVCIYVSMVCSEEVRKSPGM